MVGDVELNLVMTRCSYYVSTSLVAGVAVILALLLVQ